MHLVELQKPTSLPQAEVRFGGGWEMGDTEEDMTGTQKHMRNLEVLSFKPWPKLSCIALAGGEGNNSFPSKPSTIRFS